MAKARVMHVNTLIRGGVLVRLGPILLGMNASACNFMHDMVI
jgi:hypothetical protein